MYYNNQFNPYFQGSQNQLIRVTGMEGAKAYQMQANSTSALFDSCDDIIYIKTTDGAGFPTIRTFRFTEVKNEEVQETEFATKEDIEALRKEFSDYAKQFISNKPKQSKRSCADAEE